MDMSQIAEEIRAEQTRRDERREAIYTRVGPEKAPFYKMFIEVHDWLINFVQLSDAPAALRRELGPALSANISEAMVEGAKAMLASKTDQQAQENLARDLIKIMDMEVRATIELINRVRS